MTVDVLIGIVELSVVEETVVVASARDDVGYEVLVVGRGDVIRMCPACYRRRRNRGDRGEYEIYNDNNEQNFSRDIPTILSAIRLFSYPPL